MRNFFEDLDFDSTDTSDAMRNFFEDLDFDPTDPSDPMRRSLLRYDLALEEKARAIGIKPETDQDWIDVSAKLETFFLNGDRKKYFEICGEIEKQYKTGKGELRKAHGFFDDGDGYLECMSVRSIECEKLLGKGEEIYQHYPEEDLHGDFEFDYDAVRLWEQVRFGKTINLERIIDEQAPEYLAYRDQLYEHSIRTYCRRYPAAILAWLPEEEKRKLASCLQQAGKEEIKERERSQERHMKL